MGTILIQTPTGCSDWLTIQSAGTAPPSRHLHKEGPSWRKVRTQSREITSFENGVRQALDELKLDLETHEIFVAIESYPGYVLCSDDLGWPKARIMRLGSDWIARIYAGSVPSKVFESVPSYERDWVPLVALEWVREQLNAARTA